LVRSLPLGTKGGIALAVQDLASDELDQMGPIDTVVIAFPDGQPKGEAAPLLLDLVDRGIIRILDLMFVRKDADGSVSGLEISNLDKEGADELVVFAGAASGILSDEDRQEAGNLLDPGSAAAVIVYENRWAAPFARAMRKAGGQLVAFDRIPVQAVLAALDATEESTKGDN
jgi:uncharacterized protein DUF6325